MRQCLKTGKSACLLRCDGLNGDRRSKRSAAARQLFPHQVVHSDRMALLKNTPASWYDLSCRYTAMIQPPAFCSALPACSIVIFTPACAITMMSLRTSRRSAAVICTKPRPAHRMYIPSQHLSHDDDMEPSLHVPEVVRKKGRSTVLKYWKLSITSQQPVALMWTASQASPIVMALQADPQKAFSRPAVDFLTSWHSRRKPAPVLRPR